MQKVKAITSSLLALVVLVSTLSFTLEQHFCLGQLVDVALFSDASCGMEHSTSDSCDADLKEVDCCDEKHQVIEGQDHEATVKNSKSNQVKQPTEGAINIAATWIKNLLFSIVENNFSAYLSPPDKTLYPSASYQAALQTFLL